MSERRFGVLIASSRFPDEPRLEPLRFPENDVDGFQAVLASPDRGAFHELEVFKNKPSSEVIHRLDITFNSAEKNDLILIYYSGHGKCNSVGRLHLTTVDTQLDALKSTSISMGDILDMVETSRTKKAMIILDCCFSGAVGKEFFRSSVDDQLQQASKAWGTYFMTASTAVQVAKEKETDRHGLFTKHLIQGIRSGEADLDRDGRIGMGELYRYVHDRVIAEGAQQPMRFDFDVRGELFIARSGKARQSERNDQLRILLANLYKEGLPDEIFDQARKVIALSQDEVSATYKAQGLLLDQLLDGSIRPMSFITAWYQLDEQTTAPKPTPTIPTEKIITAPKGGYDLVWIPGGEFQMGSPDSEKGRYKYEGPQHLVRVPGFYMGRYPVTNEEYARYLSENPKSAEPEYWADRNYNQPRQPVVGVSWEDARRYALWVGLQLPSEAQWEYACRAGTRTRFYTGDTKKELDWAGWYSENSDSKLHPVGEKEPNSFGLYDMHGNVWEWVEDDWHDNYNNAPDEGIAWRDNARGSARVVRGGSWVDGTDACRSAYRGGGGTGARSSYVGFRLALPSNQPTRSGHWIAA